MKITSTNTAKPITFIWRGREVTTGIFKTPTLQPIYLGKKDVKNDSVIDRRYHGGTYKACYLFSEVHYQYWKYLYPDLDWDWGMFGENLTVSDMDETEIFVGDIYKIGNALIQVSQPREPCFKLGYRFGTQAVLKQFIKHGFSGTYASILEEGSVKAEDTLTLVERPKDSLSVAALFHLIYAEKKDQDLLNIAVNQKALPLKLRKLLSRLITI